MHPQESQSQQKTIPGWVWVGEAAVDRGQVCTEPLSNERGRRRLLGVVYVYICVYMCLWSEAENPYSSLTQTGSGVEPPTVGRPNPWDILVRGS